MTHRSSNGIHLSTVYRMPSVVLLNNYFYKENVSVYTGFNPMKTIYNL